MATFEKSMKILKELEFNSAKNMLHKNKNEDKVTFYGIYEKAHPLWRGWKIVHSALKVTKNIKEASELLACHKRLLQFVDDFYRREFYAKLKLTQIQEQHTADEIFVCAVNIGTYNAVKLAQEVVGAKVDGIIGKKTIKALQEYDKDKFDKEFDKQEIAYYDKLVKDNPKYRIYAKGWRNRALAV